MEARWQVWFDQALSKWLTVDIGSRDQAHALFEWVLDRIEHGPPDQRVQSPAKEGEWFASIDAAGLDVIFLIYRENHGILVTDFLPMQ